MDRAIQHTRQVATIVARLLVLDDEVVTYLLRVQRVAPTKRAAARAPSAIGGSFASRLDDAYDGR